MQSWFVVAEEQSVQSLRSNHNVDDETDNDDDHDDDHDHNDDDDTKLEGLP